jgi:hypothetical protein
MLKGAALSVALCALPVAAFAESGQYICAVSEVFECVSIKGCERVSTDTINLSEFIVVDLDKKTLTGASLGDKPQTEDAEGVAVTDKNIFLYGTQAQDTWNATVSLENGNLTGGISSGDSSFALFGHCTKK